MTDDQRQFPRLIAELESGITSGLHLGGQVYISRAGETLADFAFGNSQSDLPVTPDMLHPWMSASKPLAAVAIAQLMERGLLQLDDPVSKFIPEFAQGGKEGITLRQILTHTCGFRGQGRETPGTPWDQVIANVCALPLEPGWVPGEKAGYHVASSWFILGEVIRRVDGRSYPQYIREEISGPLGMHDTWVGMPLSQYVKYGSRLGWMYRTERGASEAHQWHTAEICTWCSPGGGGRGPIRELGRFYETLLLGGVVPQSGRVERAAHHAERDGHVAISLREMSGTSSDDSFPHPERPPSPDNVPLVTRSDDGYVAIIAPRDERHAPGRILQPDTVALLTRRHRTGMFDETFQHKIDWGLGFIVNSNPYGPQTVPYSFGLHASPDTFGHGGYQSSCGFADPQHQLVVAVLLNGTPGEARHGKRIRLINSAIYEDLELASD